MNKWNRVPSICLRSLPGCWARLGWILGEVPQPGLVSEVRQKGWMVHLKGVIRHLTEWASRGFARKKGSLDSSLPHLAPFTEHTCTLPQHSPLTLHMGNLCPFHFYTNISKMCKKRWHLKDFAPANMDARMHTYLKFIFYFAEACHTHSLSKC